MSQAVKVKLVKPASCHPYYLANTVGSEVTLPKEKAAQMITDGFAVPVTETKKEKAVKTPPKKETRTKK